MRTNAPEQRVPELDGLRGVAIALVLALHLVIRPNLKAWTHLLGAGPASLLNMAWCGVDIFFVLSGFLIGGIVFDRRGANNFYVAFYSRRTTRIFPAYFLLIGLAFLLTPGLDDSYAAFSWPRPIGGDVPLAGYVTFTANLYSASGFITSDWLGPVWSICIEEQFYLLAPFLLRRVAWRAVPWALCVAILGSASLRSMWMLELIPHRFAAWDFTLTRLDGLGLGVLGAYLVRTPRFVSWVAGHRLALKVALAALVLASVWLSQQARPILIGPGILLLSLTALVTILALRADPHSCLARGLRLRSLVTLGKYSYFLYLFHMPVDWIADVLLSSYGAPAPLAPIATCLMLAGLALLSWRHLESPMLRIGHRVRYQAADRLSG